MSPRIGLDLHTLLQAATEIADQDGLEVLTITTLANKLSIKPPSLYNHIEGLQDLRNKLALFGMQRLYEELTKSIKENATKDEAIKNLSLSYINFARKHPGLYEATLNAPDSSNPALQAEGNKIVQLAIDALIPYQLNEDEMLHFVRGLRSMLHGFASLEQRGGFGLSLNVNESMDLLIDTFIAGIRTLADKKAD
ncbi:transcriptional regulator [Halalkalibacter wakoensis JCM 9140]|uniref:Transcriptional regulator n=1 Tax=Halalkalibacter wakoensis JCM 9140 TaxID=1236970 RepID=W4Q936_9BACI|nr:TetR/AcrR family transcriptional regulator [Halalkalibacter wakoensis]GAE28198.1 transcriptional regulator [Halalkalibacter wakoensis JCM 9140]